jgi:hypothetical protein
MREEGFEQRKIVSSSLNSSSKSLNSKINDKLCLEENPVEICVIDRNGVHTMNELNGATNN